MSDLIWNIQNILVWGVVLVPTSLFVYLLVRFLWACFQGRKSESSNLSSSPERYVSEEKRLNRQEVTEKAAAASFRIGGTITMKRKEEKWSARVQSMDLQVLADSREQAISKLEKKASS